MTSMLIILAARARDSALLLLLLFAVNDDWESCSEDGDSDGSWIDVIHSDDDLVCMTS